MKQNKLLALILALVMAGGTFPSTALAAEITDTADNASDNTSVQVQYEVSSESNSLFKDSFSSKKKSQEKLPEASKETFGDFEYTIDEELCTGCGKCVKGCTSFGNGSLFLQIQQDVCQQCNECAIARVCPSDAIHRVSNEHAYQLKDHA